MLLSSKFCAPGVSRMATSSPAVSICPAISKLPVFNCQERIEGRSASVMMGNSLPVAARRGLSVIAASAAQEEVMVTSEKVSSTIRKLHVTVPASMVTECFETSVENMRKIVGKLKGFRTDKIPLSMIITQCGGQRKFKFTCLEEILMQTLPLVMEKQSEAIIPDSERVVSDINALADGFDPKKPVVFEIEFETTPPITWVKSYRDIEVTIRDTGDFSTDAKAADELMHLYCKDKGQQRVVAGRGLMKGDAAICDLEVRAKGSRVPLPGLKQSRMGLDTERDPLNLTEGMLGMKVGEARTFPVRFADDYSVELWQGMEAEATVKVHELFSWVLPELNDDFVKASYGEKFSSVEEMRKALIATTAMKRVQDLDKQLEDAVLEGVLSCFTVEQVPEKLVLEMGTTQYRATLMQMIEDRIAAKADIEKLATEEMATEFIEKRRADIEDMVKFNLVVDEIFAAEGLSLDDKEVEEEMTERARQYKQMQTEFDADVLREQIKDTFKHVKVIEWLKDNVKRNVVPYTAPQ